MRAHLVQMDIVWEDREANYLTVCRLLDSAEVNEGDLVVLPELFDVGFTLNLDAAPDTDNTTLAFLLRLADDLGVTLHGSRAIHPCDCDRALNTALITAPGGEQGQAICEYSKIHPFSFGREPESYRGGSQVTTYEWSAGEEQLRVCPAICYDLRFPELFRLGVQQGAECFVLGANWPAPRRAHWRTLLIARAIENQAVVLGVNRVGRDPFLDYAGGSIAIDAQGQVLGELGDEPGVLSVEIEPADVRAWRNTFPALRDIRLLPGSGV